LVSVYLSVHSLCVSAALTAKWTVG